MVGLFVALRRQVRSILRMAHSIVLNADARHIPLEDKSVQCVVTSVPFYNLRDYGVAGQIGLERTPAEYVAEIATCANEWWRVLRDDGCVWMNIGDSYAHDSKWGGATGGKHVAALHGTQGNRGRRYTGLKPKELIGIPWRVAFALQDAGWYLRSEVIWHKPNPMPESVGDRPTKAHEQVFLLTKQERYFYDAEAVAEPAIHAGRIVKYDSAQKNVAAARDPYIRTRIDNTVEVGNTRNLRSVWTIATQPFSGSHFAVMPPALAERCIKAGTSERGCCPKCGAPYQRVVERAKPKTRTVESVTPPGQNAHGMLARVDAYPPAVTVGWQAGCDCNAGEPVPCVVLDPFSGSGTTGKVALELGRNFVGVELNRDYIALSHERQTVTIGMGW